VGVFDYIMLIAPLRFIFYNSSFNMYASKFAVNYAVWKHSEIVPLGIEHWWYVR